MSGPLLFLLVALIALAGSFVQSTTGFGYAVTCMALWPLLLPFKTATVVELITATFMTVTIAVRYWKFINWRQLGGGADPAKQHRNVSAARAGCGADGIGGLFFVFQ